MCTRGMWPNFHQNSTVNFATETCVSNNACYIICMLHTKYKENEDNLKGECIICIYVDLLELNHKLMCRNSEKSLS